MIRRASCSYKTKPSNHKWESTVPTKMQRVSVVGRRSSELALSAATQLGRVTSTQQLGTACPENRVFTKLKEVKRKHFSNQKTVSCHPIR